jgi:formylglycine-generating enzyme required for sulfatase activity
MGGRYKVVRGGSWINAWYFWYLRADYRSYELPEYRYNYGGFRCVAPPLDSKK